MKLRILSGVIAASLLITLLFVGNPSWILLAVSALGLLSYLEYDALFFSQRSYPRQLRLALLIVLGLIAMHQHAAFGWVVLWIAFTYLAILHIAAANASGDFQQETRAFTLEIFGYLYVIAISGFLSPLMQLPQGNYFLLLLFFLVFGSDTGGYFVGRFFGKTTLASRLSPNKTLEGSVGAILFSLLLSLLWLEAIYPAPTGELRFRILLFAPLASLLSQLGDLLESMLKRSQGKKDSGSFLPGHGGLLDRVDGLALVAPIYYGFVVYVLL